MSNTNQITEVRLDRIRPFANQPRKHFDQEALNDLARSIKAAGQQVPVTLRPLDLKGYFELVDGERRFRACTQLGRKTILACVREYANEDDRFLASVASNFARAGHTAVETMEAIERLWERPEIACLPTMKAYAAIAEIFGRSSEWVRMHKNIRRLLPEFVAMMDLSRGDDVLSAESAFAISHQDASVQRKLLLRLRGLSPTRKTVRKYLAELTGKATPARPVGFGHGHGGHSAIGLDDAIAAATLAFERDEITERHAFLVERMTRAMEQWKARRRQRITQAS